ncbi:MAG: hypothetical protein Q7R68_11025 [Nitrospirales bacterium]|nr:hypothetical protein [Nitrospirales bacterium]
MPDAQGNLLPGEAGYQAPGTGLLNSTPGQTNVTPGAPIVNYTPALAEPKAATATGYTPTPYGVAPKQTVAEQVKTIVGEDSPLMQQAATRAKQTMVDRGLLNSSLAIDAGQNAVIAQAMPIATADAATYDRAATNTANAENASKGILTQATNTAELQNANAATSVDVSNAGNINFALNVGATAANTAALNKALAGIDNEVKLQLGTLDAQNRQLLQTNANAANMYQETVKNIAAIATDHTISEEAKKTATATQMNLLNEGLRTTAAVAATAQAAVSALDLSSYFQDTSGSLSGSQTITPGGTFAGQGGQKYATQSAADNSWPRPADLGQAGHPYHFVAGTGWVAGAE